MSRPGIGICPFCAQVVAQGERAYFEAIGWEEQRKGGGTNALRLRNRTGAVAHWMCVDRAAHGRDGQLNLLSSDRRDTLSVTDREE